MRGPDGYAPRKHETTMARKNPGLQLTLRDVEQSPNADGTEQVALHTDHGTIRCRYHQATGGDTAVLWVFGAGGGLGGPAGGVYHRLGRQVVEDSIASLELDYRRPADLTHCVLDVLMGIGYLGSCGRTRVVLVGHSFGGAVVITAGALSKEVIAVAAMSSQLSGTDLADQVSPRPLLVVHGTADEVLPDRCSREIYRRAKEPKQLLLYPGCLHGLDQCRDELDRDLLAWIRKVVA